MVDRIPRLWSPTFSPGKKRMDGARGFSFCWESECTGRYGVAAGRIR
jgi:hypothetical protein